jgi:Phage head completion protein (GPL).
VVIEARVAPAPHPSTAGFSSETPMPSLIANGGPAVPSPEPAPAASIQNDGFWPDIVMADVRAAVRLAGNITDERLRASLVASMIWANGELVGFKALRVSEGWEHAQDVGESIDGHSILVQRYRRAVYCYTQADIADNYRQWDNTRAGDYRADFEDSAASTARRDANWAISDILGRGRSVVELI